MKIAVTYENGNVFQHFGHTAQFKVYTVEGGKVVSTQVVDTNGSGHGALAGFLEELGVNALICRTRTLRFTAVLWAMRTRLWRLSCPVR